MSKLVTFEQKKALRKLGYDFDSICFCGGSMDCICEHLPDENKLITVSSALDWIRDKYGVYCGIIPYMWNYRGKAIFQGKLNLSCPNEIMTDNHELYDLAESALLDAVLTCLEQKTTDL